MRKYLFQAKWDIDKSSGMNIYTWRFRDKGFKITYNDIGRYCLLINSNGSMKNAKFKTIEELKLEAYKHCYREFFTKK